MKANCEKCGAFLEDGQERWYPGGSQTGSFLVEHTRERCITLAKTTKEVCHPQSEISRFHQNEISRLRMELTELYATKHKMTELFGQLALSYEKKCDENKRMREALRACGIARCNSDTCTVCGLHFADCEDERLADEVDGEFVDIGPACPGAVARAIIGEKK